MQMNQHWANIVGLVGFKPTQSYDNRFTVCPDSSTSAQPQIFCDTSGTRTQDPNIKD